MSRLTPLGTAVLLLLIIIVVGGGLALTGNLRWPPFGLQLPASVALPPPALPEQGADPNAATGVSAANTPVPAGSAAPFAATTEPTQIPTATHTATSTPTNTAAPSNTPTATPSPTPLGLVYAGGLDVPGAAKAQPVAVDPNGHMLYVVSTSAEGRAALTAFDEGTLAPTAQVELNLPGVSTDPLAPLPVLLSLPTHRIYVVGSTGQILALDSGSLATVRTYTAGQTVAQAFLNPPGTKLFVVQRDLPGSKGAALRVVDLRDGISSAILIPARWAADSAFADGNTLYLTGRDGLLPLDMVTITFGDPILLGFQPLFPVFDATDRRLFSWLQPQSVPLEPQLSILNANGWQSIARLTHDRCPCPLAVSAERQRLYLAVATSPGRVLAYPLQGSLDAPDEMILNAVPAESVLPSPGSSRLYVQSTGPHPILIMQDNGPAPPGQGPVTINVK